MSGAPQRRAVLIAGPTASGKSALALTRAKETGGLIVNTDAMQVYDVLRVVTARPSVADEAEAEHRLYGFVSPAERFSTGAWASAVEKLIQETDPARTLIFVGGTGLYFEALTNGFAEVPAIPAEIVAEAEKEIQGLDAENRARLVAERDPEIARRLQAPDPQRVVRALAVLKATGRSLASYQDAAQTGLLEGFELERLVLNPDRDVLRVRIARRFETMFTGGAVEEVEAVMAMDLDPALPAMKAIGVREIADVIAGRMDEAEAIERAVIATRQYAKRQRTWMRNRMSDWTWIAA
ncbi:tRNA (adenosine(37)-N6)-dimethylallyltransferase MiaA [Paradevosia shaoguanensis]|uniref:tRNA (adenosine(37)-N6)-dimethylallyltransferase MiaA n=1 Tax=Paradevosia shaoguanensis TaxID=1335043 RepID=UPI001933A557|nr:tRNA (adenosine(37)-N6)-dimethylallyltransferase MiaA [Paradevosia shaoguanensis]